jgi:hypothetical protein
MSNDDQAKPKFRLAMVLLIPSEPPDYSDRILNHLLESFPDVRLVYRKLDPRPLWISTTPPEASRL